VLGPGLCLAALEAAKVSVGEDLTLDRLLGDPVSHELVQSFYDDRGERDWMDAILDKY
jgi:hypothetical protein